MCWLLVSYFDGEFMRTVFGAVVGFGIFGPFAQQWYYLFIEVLVYQLDDLDMWFRVALFSVFTTF